MLSITSAELLWESHPRPPSSPSSSCPIPPRASSTVWGLSRDLVLHPGKKKISPWFHSWLMIEHPRTVRCTGRKVPLLEVHCAALDYFLWLSREFDSSLQTGAERDGASGWARVRKIHIINLQQPTSDVWWRVRVSREISVLVLVSRPLLKGLSLVLDSEAFVFIWSCLDIGLGRLGIFFFYQDWQRLTLWWQIIKEKRPFV